MYIPIWILVILAVALYFVFRMHSKNRGITTQEGTSKEKEFDALKNRLEKSFEISDRRTLIIVKDEYEAYWAKNTRDRISGFRNYAEPIFSKEKSEATTSSEFENSLSTAMGHAPWRFVLLGSEPTEREKEFKHWEEEGRGEFSDILILLKTRSLDAFVHAVIFDENISDKRLTKNEEEIVQKAINACGSDIKPVDISKMFAKRLLSYAGNSIPSNIRANHQNEPQDINVIDKFLEYWGKLLLVSEHQDSLARIASFMKGDFEKLFEKITDDTVSFVLSQQKKLIMRLEELYKHDKI